MKLSEQLKVIAPMDRIRIIKGNTGTGNHNLIRASRSYIAGI